MEPLAGEMDCSNTMDLLSPRQMSSSPESPEAFGLPTRPSESITVFGHSSSASSGSLLGPISVTLGNKINQPGTAASIPDFGFAPPSAHGDKRTLLQVSRPPSFNPSRAPCPRSSVVPASGGFNTRSLDIGGVYKHASSLDSANSESAKAFVYSIPSHVETLFNNAFPCIFNEDCCGTINAFIDAGDRYLVGVDSRSTTKALLDKIISKEAVSIFHSDNEVKCEEVVKGTVITGCGSAKRWEKICKFVKEEVKLQGKRDVHSVVGHVKKYVASYPLTGASVGTQMFVVGESSMGQVFVFRVGDGLTNSDQEPLFDEFKALGSGRDHAEIVLRDLRKPNKRGDKPKFTLNEAIDQLYKALLHATVCDECCGGNITVWQVAPHVCEKISPPPCGSHCIDLAIYLQYKFEDGELFFFDKSSYYKMNYYILTLFIESRGFTTNKPSCFGFVRDDWKLFSVRFLSKKESVDLYRMGVRVREGIRRLMIYGVLVFVATANTGMLNLARNTNFLCEM